MQIIPKQTRHLVVGLALVSLACVMPSMAVAQPHGPMMRKHNCVPIDIRVLVPKYDVNKNGKLDPAEAHTMMRAKRRADLAKYDKDRDGVLSKKEHSNLRHGKMVAHFEALDRNRNAEITAAEAKGSCTPIEWHFARVDQDSNGSVTWTEFAAAAKKFRPPHHRRGPGSHRHGPPRRRSANP